MDQAGAFISVGRAVRVRIWGGDYQVKTGNAKRHLRLCRGGYRAYAPKLRKWNSMGTKRNEIGSRMWAVAPERRVARIVDQGVTSSPGHDGKMMVGRMISPIILPLIILPFLGEVSREN